MKKKHIIALVGVLALVVSLMSSFAFATAPETEVEAEATQGARTGGVHYVVKTSTYLYLEADIDGAYAYPSILPAGTHLVRVNSLVYADSCYKMQYGSYFGYIPSYRLTEVQ